MFCRNISITWSQKQMIPINIRFSASYATIYNHGLIFNILIHRTINSLHKINAFEYILAKHQQHTSIAYKFIELPSCQPSCLL